MSDLSAKLITTRRKKKEMNEVKCAECQGLEVKGAFGLCDTHYEQHACVECSMFYCECED